ncbi:DUF4231 domain-containing protein [Streptomyces sp. NPDC005774]|uniref:DUF4231 domain-containing protein n=1 Tax=Streptomyces sp. NPDC005774 TaxID=3364728 RepID=UPI0036A9F169
MARNDLPGLYRAASDTSRRGQKTHIRLTRLRLSMAILAALAGTLSTTSSISPGSRRIYASFSIAFFTGALVAEILLLKERPDRSWYGGRALAESIKTLAWRFSVCSAPFPKEMQLDEAERLFRRKLRELLSLHSVRLMSNVDPLVTENMAAIRASSLSERMECYIKYRIDAQCVWYADNSNKSERAAKRWKILLLLLEALGLVTALLVLLDYSFLDFSGVLAALIIAGVAWVEVRQFDSVAEAYALTSLELSLIRHSVAEVSTEQSWSTYVHSAEQGISREHTMWLAKRSGARNAF